MSRAAHIVVLGYPHHVTQQVNRRADVFEVGEDYEACLRFLKEHADRCGLIIWAYCLLADGRFGDTAIRGRHT